MVTILVWYITTNRLPIRFNKKIKIALLINLDDEKYEARIKNIILECIQSTDENSKNTEIILMPFNYLKSDKEIKKYLDKRGFLIETLFKIRLSSGNFQSESITHEKITIDEVCFYSRLSLGENKRIYKSDISMVPDIKLINYHKNWEYIETNSKADKLKYKINLSDLILQYIALYLIYLDEFEKSLEILKKIHKNPEEVKVNKNKNNFKRPRFNSIILELLMKVSMNYYFEIKDIQSCHSFLLSSFDIVGENHPEAFDCCANLALTSYKLGDLPSSKVYTEKAKKINPNSCVVALNEAFYLILEDKPKEVARKYNLLRVKYSNLKSINILEVIEFLANEKGKFVGQPNFILFEFAEGFLSLYYGDKNLGISILESFFQNYTISEIFNQELYDLALSALREKNKQKKYIRYLKAS